MGVHTGYSKFFLAFFQFLIKIKRQWPHRLAWLRTLGFHPSNTGSNPVGATGFLAIFVMIKDYSEISKASDISSAKERRIYRVFETLPGITSLGTLFGVLIFSWFRPDWVAIFIILFCFYYLFKICYLSFYQVTSYIRMKKKP